MPLSIKIGVINGHNIVATSRCYSLNVVLAPRNSPEGVVRISQATEVLGHGAQSVYFYVCGETMSMSTIIVEDALICTHRYPNAHGMLYSVRVRNVLESYVKDLVTLVIHNPPEDWVTPFDGVSPLDPTSLAATKWAISGCFAFHLREKDIPILHGNCITKPDGHQPHTGRKGVIYCARNSETPTVDKRVEITLPEDGTGFYFHDHRGPFVQRSYGGKTTSKQFANCTFGLLPTGSEIRVLTYSLTHRTPIGKVVTECVLC